MRNQSSFFNKYIILFSIPSLKFSCFYFWSARFDRRYGDNIDNIDELQPQNVSSSKPVETQVHRRGSVTETLWILLKHWDRLQPVAEWNSFDMCSYGWNKGEIQRNISLLDKQIWFMLIFSAYWINLFSNDIAQFDMLSKISYAFRRRIARIQSFGNSYSRTFVTVPKGTLIFSLRMYHMIWHIYKTVWNQRKWQWVSDVSQSWLQINNTAKNRFRRIFPILKCKERVWVYRFFSNYFLVLFKFNSELTISRSNIQFFPSARKIQ